MKQFAIMVLVATAAAILLPFMVDPARAQSDAWPTKPVHWVVPFPPGGATDVVARIVAQRLSERLKQPVIIDNRPGAASNIGMEAVARAAPDGYTILFAVPSLVINPVLYKLTFDPMKDLVPVTQLTGVQFVLLAGPEFAPRNVAQILAAAKASPGTVTCAAAGALPQFACELLKALGQVDITTVPYKGNAQAMIDVVGGQVSMLFDVVNVAMPQVKARRVRAIAMTNPKRGTGPFPGVPMMNESLAGFELLSWQGVLTPAATPHEIGAVLEEAEVKKRITDSGLEVTHGSPEAFAQVIGRDYAKYEKIIRDVGMRAE